MSDADPSSARAMFRASLPLLVLSLLSDGPRHGYAVLGGLKRTTGHDPGAATLYPLLRELSESGLLICETQPHAGRTRKVYRLTDAGQKTLRSSGVRWQAEIARLQSVVFPALRATAHQRPQTAGSSTPSAAPTALPTDPREDSNA